ncbi:MAG TPA: mechanosensitive ion channel family protein [Candidatus Saccharimonadales bacterium]|nr:mechanosensitive ion channel family protein [Candidatus Saccharimonadales bacterium]
MRVVKASFRLLLLLSLLCAPLFAQSVLKALSSGVSTAPSATKNSDPLGRATPRGTLTGFMQAAQRGENDRAAEYLQLPRQESEIDSARVVQDLKTLLDNAYVGRLGAITDNPDLAFDPQLEANHQRVGEFTVNGKELPLLVVRVPDGNSGHLWLIAWSTLGKTEDLATDVRSHQVERHLPRILVRQRVLSIPIWVWSVFLLLIPVALLAGVAAVALASAPAWLLARINHRAAQSEVWTNIRGPVLLFATAAAHAIGMRMITVPLLFREYYLKVQATAVLFAVSWLLWDFVTVWTRRTRRRMIAPEERGTLSLSLLLHRVLKLSIAVVGVLSILYLAGFDLSAALAGLGIGGIAVALAAQKTIENLFGGISILTDRVMRVGDLCRVGDTIGTVEDIGLRSTRIRTYERGLISVPNGSLATANVENLSARDKMRVFCKVGLRYETSREQLERVLVQVSAMLRDHPRVESSTAWIRLAKLAESALELEMQAYVLTREYDDYTTVREDLLLRVMDIVESCGTSLAYPSQTVYLAREAEAANSTSSGK